MNYALHLLIYINIFVVVGLSLNLLVGYCGLLTLAHAGYFAVGAYTYALLSSLQGWAFLPAAVAAGVLAGILSLAVSLPAWRLRGDFFVLASLAVQALLFSALYNWSNPTAPLGSWRNLTNGPAGITGIPRPSVLGWSMTTPWEMALFSTLIAIGCGLIVWRLTSSPWGRLLTSMREDELAVRGLGKNTRIIKVETFVIACALAAVAGALYASDVRYVDPSCASLDDGILMLSMVIVGGLGNFRGPVVGATVLILFPAGLRFLDLPDVQAANLRLLIYGLLLVLMMHFRPQGIAGTYRDH